MEFYVIAKNIDEIQCILLQVFPISNRVAQITSTSPGYINPYPAPTTLIYNQCFITLSKD